MQHTRCVEFMFRPQYVQVAVKIKNSGKKSEKLFVCDNHSVMNEVSVLGISVWLPSNKNVIHRATEENRCSSEWPFQPYLIFDVGDGREERDHE